MTSQPEQPNPSARDSSADLLNQDNHHDSGYKELFSYPELVQQLIEGFAPAEITKLMDFSTLKQHSGHYITPLFEEKREDLVWSVEVSWGKHKQTIYLYLLLEFQSSSDSSMALRMMHYVAGFYSGLLKSKQTDLRRGLPPVFPIVLYNGNNRWLKRHFFRLGDTRNWEHIHSLTEDHAMIAENLKTLAQKERAEGRQQGIEQGIEQGYQKARAEAEKRMIQAVMKMLLKGLPAEDVAEFFDLSTEEVLSIKQQHQH